MSVPNFETVIVRKVYDNVLGTKVSVGEDGDGLGLVEVDGGDDYGRITMPADFAVQVADAIAKCAAEVAAKAA